MDDTAELGNLTIDYLILADGAQVQNGKLYVLGGGWERLQFETFPQTIPVGIALGVRVPWSETNRKHSFRVRGLSTDGQELFGGEGEFELGRPPGLPKGMSQMFQIAMTLPLPVPAAGSVHRRGHHRRHRRPALCPVLRRRDARFLKEQ